MITAPKLLAVARACDRTLGAIVAWPVRGYRLLLSSWLGSACRFTPTCSSYALQALDSHGGMHGSYLTTRRVLRCHPWCAGGLDPVPPGALAQPLTNPATPCPSTPLPAPWLGAPVVNNPPANTP
jgi:uncharacterized protein